MLKLNKEKIKLRAYQEKTLGAIVDKNSFIVLPTGAGKTIIAVALAGIKLRTGKVLVMAPTKPLVAQHKKSFDNFFENSELIGLVDGTIKSEIRKDIWLESDLIVATPQTVVSDLEKNFFDPEKFSLVVFDEAHRTSGNYAYAKLMESIDKSQILAMSASPATDKERLDELRSLLKIEKFHIVDSSEMSDYLPDREIEIKKIKLNKIQIEIKKMLTDMIKEDYNILKKNRLVVRNYEYMSKGELISLNKRLFSKVSDDSKLYYFIKINTKVIKLLFLLEMLETQTNNSFLKALEKLSTESAKSSKSIMEDFRLIRIKRLSKNLEYNNKMNELKNLIDFDKKIIIFCQYTNSVDEIVEYINSSNIGVAKKFTGQRKGFTQKNQKKVLGEFKDGEFNVLVATSVSEEGIHVDDADVGIFFECIPSALRSIQRRGRIGRVNIGKIYMLMTENSIDEKYYWVSKRKEENMYKLLKR